MRFTDAAWRLTPRRSARLGAFAAILLGLTVIASFGIGVRGNFPDRPGGRTPNPGAPDRCLTLTYRGIQNDGWLPSKLRLTADVKDRESPTGPRYRAIDESGGVWEWRFAGRDSVDISSYHSPVIRLPAEGRSIKGRIGPYGYNTVLEALLAEPDGQVFATSISCPLGR
jgi:hypothetical protein